MSNGFAQSVNMLWPIAARQLGWLPDEFWRATPEELVSALIDPSKTRPEPISRGEIQAIMANE